MINNLTVNSQQIIKNNDKTYSNYKKILSVAAFVLLFIILTLSETLSEAIYLCIKDTGKKIIPALFPMMVLSRFMTEYGLLDFLGGCSANAVNKIFGVCKKSVGALVLGFLSSFPIGAMTVCNLYEKGELTKTEAENALGPAHNTGPAFPVMVIGSQIYGNTITGMFIYFTQFISSVITSKILIKKTTDKIKQNQILNKRTYNNFSTSLTNAVCSSALGCVNIIAYVTFGRIMIVLLSELLMSNTKLLLIATVITEFSTGSCVSAYTGGLIGFILCSFSISFGGITSMLQASSHSSKVGISMKKCVFFKILQGIIASLLSIFGYFILF